jgi:hypothetical protein
MTTQNVFTYPRNEPGTLGHLDLVEPLRAMPGEVEAALQGLRESDLDVRASDDIEERGLSARDAWSIRDTVAHLADSTRINHQRLYMMSTQTDPWLPAFDPEARRAEGETRDIPALLAEIKHWRGDTVALLTSLVNWNWARSGRHETLGRVSIRQLVEHMLDDEATHLAALRAR